MARVSRPWLASLVAACALAIASIAVPAAARAQELPELTAPVNDFAHVIDPQSASALDTLIRSLQQASGDVVVVATVDTVAPYADAADYAVRMFENRGRGIGAKGKDNGLLVLLAVKERQVRVEVGYGLEGFVTDGFSLPEAKSEVEWLDENHVFVGTDFGPGSLTDSGHPRVVKLWKRGSPLTSAIADQVGHNVLTPDDRTPQLPEKQPEPSGD